MRGALIDGPLAAIRTAEAVSWGRTPRPRIVVASSPKPRPKPRAGRELSRSQASAALTGAGQVNEDVETGRRDSRICCARAGQSEGAWGEEETELVAVVAAIRSTSRA